MRLALLGLVVALAAAAIIVLAGADPDSETAPSVRAPRRTELLMRTPRAVVGTCRSAASAARKPPHCPLAIPVPDGTWGHARALDSNPCEYLIDVGPGRRRGESARDSIYHLLFGSRCRRFDLAADHRRWPKDGFVANDLRLVGVAPLKPGQSSVTNHAAPARARVVRRMRIDGSPAILLRYPAHPLTTVHSAHLAIVWNEAHAGYAVSGHPSDPQTTRQERRTIEALRAMALALRNR